MKTITVLALLAVVIAAIFSAVCSSGCAPQGNVFGAPISEATVTPIGDILAQPQRFQDKTVRVEGKITQECPAGGWFFLQDATGMVYVNLHPSELAIPQAVGRQAVAQGVVRQEGPQVEIIGKGVQLK